MEAQDGDWGSEERRADEDLSVLGRSNRLSFLFDDGTINFRIITHVT